MASRPAGWSWPGLLIMLGALVLATALAPPGLHDASWGVPQLTALAILLGAGWAAGRVGCCHGAAVMGALGAACFVGFLPSRRGMFGVGLGIGPLVESVAFYVLFVIAVALTCGYLANRGFQRATRGKLRSEDVCPTCGYDLRGLTERRCPECGAPFEWPPPPPIEL